MSKKHHTKPDEQVLIFKSQDMTKHAVTDGDGKPVIARGFMITCMAGELAEVRLLMDILTVEAVGVNPQLMVTHPITGALKHVKRIEFADGTCFPEKSLNAKPRLINLRARSARK